MKPKGITETTIAMCFMNIAGFAFIDPKAGAIEIQYAIVSVVVGITFLILWYYWKGANWARILALLTGALAVFNLVLLSGSNLLVDAIIVIEAVFGAFMLWWLNTQSVKSYFKKT